MVLKLLEMQSLAPLFLKIGGAIAPPAPPLQAALNMKYILHIAYSMYQNLNIKGHLLGQIQ